MQNHLLTNHGQHCLTPKRILHHQSQYTLKPHPLSDDQFKKRVYFANEHHPDSEFDQKQTRLRNNLQARLRMIAFYQQEANRRKIRHSEMVRQLRKRSDHELQKRRKLLEQLRIKNDELQNAQQSARNSLSYSAIYESNSLDEAEITGGLGK